MSVNAKGTLLCSHALKHVCIQSNGMAKRHGRGDVETRELKDRPRLYHGIQPHWSWMSSREPEGKSTNKSSWARPNIFQICSITSVWSFHSPGPQLLSRQDICFLICKRPLTYCLCALAHGDLSDQSVPKLEILPASPGN